MGDLVVKVAVFTPRRGGGLCGAVGMECHRRSMNPCAADEIREQLWEATIPDDS